MDLQVASKQPCVTLVIVQRERFSLTRPALASVLADDSYPFQLIYVDGGSPAHVHQYLQEQASQHQCMTLVRREHYLRTNAARNLVMPMTQSADYVVFLDNDVVVERGWLKALVECAEQEQAAIVAPLVLEGNPQKPEKQVHAAGSKLKYALSESGRASLASSPRLSHARLSQRPLHRQAVDAVEVHCIMLRRSLLEAIELDEAFDSLEGHIDICLQAKLLGEIIFMEPASRVTFLNPQMIPVFEHHDVPFHLFKWNESYLAQSSQRLQQKWNLASTEPLLWGLWSWAITNRQLPIKLATSSDSFYRTALNFCKLRFCPSWLRVVIETSLLKLLLPQPGMPFRFDPEDFNLESFSQESWSESATPFASPAQINSPYTPEETIALQASPTC